MRTLYSSFGRNIRVTVYGGSHEPVIGVQMEGFPERLTWKAGEAPVTPTGSLTPESIDEEALLAFLARRAPGKDPYSTPRKEADRPLLRSRDPLVYEIQNTNQQSRDYDQLAQIPRPGHADYTAQVRYQGTVNMAGGGPFSGRMTAPLCIAGGIAKQLLATLGITIQAELIAAGGVGPGAHCRDLDTLTPSQKEDLTKTMYQRILEAKGQLDSVGGLVRCQATGLPAGIGGAMYQGLESYIAPIIFGIPGVKGLSFGAGFDAASMTGSTNNDPFVLDDKGHVKTSTNNAGGILGGISTGMPLVMDVAFKPTPSIAKPQETLDLSTLAPTVLKVGGRHDPCIALRGVPVVEGALALGLLDALLEPEEA